jgi:uncharacterized protein
MMHWQIASFLRAICILTVLAGAASAGPLEEALAAHDRGDYATTLRIVRPLAEKGDPEAQSALGYMYEEGKGVRVDFGQALIWYRKAAAQEEAQGQNNLGRMYEQGRGVSQDYVQAVAWFRKAAEQGFAMAQSNLGQMYAQGHGVSQDYVQASAWFRKAADQGDSDGQFQLGYMYLNGMGVVQDYVFAHMWSNLAASQLPPGRERDAAVRNRNFATRKMTPVQINEAQRMAAEWKPRQDRRDGCCGRLPTERLIEF